MNQPPAECSVPGALGAALRISRVAGVAPLQFRRLRTGSCARVSHAANLYGMVLAFIFLTTILAAFVTDFYIIEDTLMTRRIRIRSIVFFVELILMMGMVFATSLTGNMRMNNMIVYLNQIHKINLALSSYGSAPSDGKTSWLLLILSMVGGTIIISLKSGLFMYLMWSNPGRVLMPIMYVFCFLLYFFMYMILLIVQTQFALLVVTALSPLKQLNGCLNVLHREIGSKDVTKPSKLQRDIPEAVHHLTRLHSCMCDVVRLVDQSHGPILLTLLLSYLLHLLFSLYFIFNFFLIDEEPSFYSIVSQAIWGIFQISSLIIVVEPCHQTQEEIVNAREIVGQMTQKVASPDDPLSIELELFYRHLILNKVAYSPLKMLTVNRALTVTMLSAITTYLVVVIKF